MQFPHRLPYSKAKFAFSFLLATLLTVNGLYLLAIPPAFEHSPLIGKYLFF